MRISLRAKKTIEWLKANENKGGGIAAWVGFASYPEVTGYLLPSLLAYGEKEFAARLGDWLVSIQAADGSYKGLDGVPRVFDTFAVYEGLTALGKNYRTAAAKAAEWIAAQKLPSGFYRSQHDSERVDFYTARAAGTLDKAQAAAWMKRDWFDGGKQRAHYLAYGWEGLLTAGLDVTAHVGKLTIAGLAPAYVDREYKIINGSDTCATAQLGILRLKCGLDFDPAPLYAMQHDNGGWRHDQSDAREIAWAAKYVLDLERLLNG
jgi:hypothetical protein